MLKSNVVIAIDGPAGAGKSTVAKQLAERLGIKLLDTGAMYRALAFKAIQNSIESSNEAELCKLAESTEITFDIETKSRVHVDGQDVSELIRTLHVGEFASQISVFPRIRTKMVALQQQVITSGGYVLEGRDVTTVVAPNADLKIFLTASIEERARRRWLELRSEQPDNTLQNVVKDVVIRDHRDYTREVGALMLAEDAMIVESFGLSVEQVVDHIISLIK